MQIRIHYKYSKVTVMLVPYQTKYSAFDVPELCKLGWRFLMDPNSFNNNVWLSIAVSMDFMNFLTKKSPCNLEVGKNLHMNFLLWLTGESTFIFSFFIKAAILILCKPQAAMHVCSFTFFYLPRRKRIIFKKLIFENLDFSFRIVARVVAVSTLKPHVLAIRITEEIFLYLHF